MNTQPEQSGISLDDQIKAVGREIGLRKAVYPRQVGQGRMSQKTADHEIAAMQAVYQRLKEAKARGEG